MLPLMRIRQLSKQRQPTWDLRERCHELWRNFDIPPFQIFRQFDFNLIADRVACFLADLQRTPKT